MERHIYARRDHYTRRVGKWWRYLGANPTRGSFSFRVWAPACRQVDLVLERNGQTIPLRQAVDGFYFRLVPRVASGTRYRYRLDGGEAYPDPSSRFQPEGPHGPSMVVDQDAFRWTDQEWEGIEMRGQVIYELHVGAFTPEGTLDAARQKLLDLKRLGVTVIELMPLTEFSGRWNWGYDGVCLFASSHHYGDPEALKRFVDQAHALGLGVILDVVYNHLGPDGNHLRPFSSAYFSNRHTTPWGEAFNFDGEDSEHVRQFVIANACYWVAEFHLDGFRLDATNTVADESRIHILSELSRAARRAAKGRKIIVTAENEPQDLRCLAPFMKGGFGCDALWVEDFHHASHVALTGRRQAYYADYVGEARELVSSLKRGLLFQGQRSRVRQKPRGAPVTDQPAWSFVFYLENHDQASNHPEGRRLSQLTNPGRYRAGSAILLLAPETPLVFMGQEFGSSAPFFFFCDFGNGDLAARVREGRNRWVLWFADPSSSISLPDLPDPNHPSTFQACKLDWLEQKTHAGVVVLYRDLLRIRREDPVMAAQSREDLDGTVFGSHALVLRFFGRQEHWGSDRLLLVNLGSSPVDLPISEPLLTPVPGGAWDLVWSSDDPGYGGSGVVNPLEGDPWSLPGESAVLFRSTKRRRPGNHYLDQTGPARPRL